MGFLLAVVAAAAFWAALHIAATGAQTGRICVKLLRPRPMWAMAGLAAAAWVYKMATWQAG
jgi:hypothetical protein